MAKSVEVSQPHQLSLDEARIRTDSLLKQLQDRYGLATSWVSENQAKVEGLGVQGTAVLEKERVFVTAQLSLPASLAAGTIEQALRDSLASKFA